MLPTLPPAPSRTDPTNFSAKADAWVDALADWTDAANALEQSLQLVATTGTSTSSLPIGTGSKGLTTQTGKAWGVGSWVYIASASSITNLMQGQVTAYNAGTGNLVVNVTQSTGSGTYTDWVIALASPTTNSANLSGGVAGSIPYQSGVNTTMMLAAGSAGKILVSNGASAPSWEDNSRLLNVQYIITSGTYTSTPGTRRRIIELIGGGGGASGMPVTAAGQIAFNQCGNSGLIVEVDSTYDWDGATITIGAAGAAGASNAAGGNGGATSISKAGFFVSAGGGLGGGTNLATSTFPTTIPSPVIGSGGLTSSLDALTKIISLKVTPPDLPVAITSSLGFLPRSPRPINTLSLNWWPTSLLTNPTTLGEHSASQGEGGRYAVSGQSQAAKAGYSGVAGSIKIYEYT